MNFKKRGLGKGLSDLGLGALLGDLQSAPTPVSELSPSVVAMAAVAEMSNNDGELKKLPIDSLKPGQYQPRKVIAPEALEELANSIRTQGVIQPIVVRQNSDYQYEIIAGERRWRAAQLAGLSEVPCIARHYSDHDAAEVTLIENIQREGLNPIEEARALQCLLDEFHYTHDEIAKSIGKSRTKITNALRLLQLDTEVQQWLIEKKLT